MANGQLTDRELLIEIKKDVEHLTGFTKEHLAAGEKRMDSIEKRVGDVENKVNKQPIQCTAQDGRIAAIEKVCKKMPTTGKITTIIIVTLTLLTTLFVWYEKVLG